MNILFTSPSDQKILAGTKTMTARCWRKNPPEVGAIIYAQTGRSNTTRFAKLRVLDVREWNGYQISSGWYSDEKAHYELAQKIAKKEGFDSAMDFLYTYRELNLHNWTDAKRKHWFIEFEVVERL